jgi:hypothetical protein
MQNGEKNRSALEKWLYENRLTYAEAGRLFGCSGEFVRLIAQGERRASDELGETILDCLTGRKTLDDLRREANDTV